MHVEGTESQVSHHSRLCDEMLERPPGSASLSPPWRRGAHRAHHPTGTKLGTRPGAGETLKWGLFILMISTRHSSVRSQS